MTPKFKLHKECCWPVRPEKIDEFEKRIRSGEVPPATVWVGNQLLDGYHREVAAARAGVKIARIQLPKGEDPAAFVHRTHQGTRQLTISEMAAQVLHRVRTLGVPLEDALSLASPTPEYRRVLVINVKLLEAGSKTSRPRKAAFPIATPLEAERLLEHTREPITFGELLEKLDVGPSALRRMIEAARAKGHTLHVDMTSTLTDRSEHRLRAEIRDLNAAKKNLLDELESRERQIETFTALQSAKPIPIVAKRAVGEGKRRQGTVVMLMSDLHVEEPVDPAKVNGLNEYNLDIAERCIDRCGEAFAYFCNDPRWDIREGIIGLIGDTYSGYIHAELQETTFLSPVQAVVWLQDRLERCYRGILKNTKIAKLTVICKDGNHGRLTQKIRAATRTENSLEWLLFKTLSSRFADEKRISFVIEDGLYTYMDAYDETFAFTHGDQFMYQGGVGGLLIPVRRGLNEIRKYKTGLKRNVIFCMGHFHERMDVGDIVINGSAIGVTPWSFSKNFKPERRAQHIFLVDSARGKDAPNAPVWLPLK
jgi:hypothetical protein